MVGDDVVNDVGGAKGCGMKGILVRTGKYRSVMGFESHRYIQCACHNEFTDVVTMVHNHSIHTCSLFTVTMPHKRLFQS